MIPTGISNKYLSEIHAMRIELREMFASLNDEARDKFVYLHKEEYDHTDTDTVNYLAEQIIEQLSIQFQCETPLFDADISRRDRSKFMIPATTTAEYDAYLEKTGTKNNQAVRAEMERRERYEKEFREQTGRKYIPSSSQINDVVQKLIALFASMYDEQAARQSAWERFRRGPYYFFVVLALFVSAFIINMQSVNRADPPLPIFSFLGVIYLLAAIVLMLEPLFNKNFRFFKKKQ